VPRIAITGHINLTPDSVPLVYKAINGALALYVADELTGISYIARGADSVFARLVTHPLSYGMGRVAWTRVVRGPSSNMRDRAVCRSKSCGPRGWPACR
jgi:hypothetical protein